MTIRIITDGGADLPPGLVGEDVLSIVPLHVTFGDEAFDSGLGMSAFYHRMKSSKLLPKTASPSPQDFLNRFEQFPGDDLLVIALSSELSSTYQHALLAKEMLLEQGFDRRIEVIDTRSASIGQGIILYRTAQAIAAGKSYDEVFALAMEYTGHSRTLFYLDTLENVIKGGRLDRAKGAIATVLNIKVLMHATPEGRVDVLEKVRGKKNALNRLIDKLEELGGAAGDRVIGIAFSGNEEEARSIGERIMARYPFREMIYTEIGPVIGTYAGEGGIVVSCS